MDTAIIDMHISFLTGTVICIASLRTYDYGILVQIFFRFVFSQQFVFIIAQITMALIDHEQWDGTIIESFEFLDITRSEHFGVELTGSYFDDQIFPLVFDQGIEISAI